MPQNDDDNLEALARDALLDDDDEVHRRKKRHGLRLVAGTDKPPRLERSTKLFAKAPEEWLLAADCSLPPRWRWYFLLQIRSKQGTKRVGATNKLATQIGLASRSDKLRHLRALEKLGLVTVMRDGKKEPTVTLCPIPGWPPPRRPR
jgi:hypothetical protein